MVLDQSNDTGNYNFPSLQPGQYTVTATMSGFQTSTYTNLNLGQGENVRQNFTLQIASATTSIEVVEEAPTISSTTTASVGAVLSERAVFREVLRTSLRLANCARTYVAAINRSAVKAGLDFMVETRDPSLLQFRPSLTRCKELWDEGIKIPGVHRAQVESISLTKVMKK